MHYLAFLSRPRINKSVCFRYPPSTESERGRRLRTALSIAESIDDARRSEQRKRAKERRKAMEKERRKAIRNARQRQKEAKMKKTVSFQVNLETKVSNQHTLVQSLFKTYI